jgi:hypothetical protein
MVAHDVCRPQMQRNWLRAAEMLDASASVIHMRSGIINDAASSPLNTDVCEFSPDGA